jgi:FMN phosphatase YigB (HAD superfamily)
LNPEKKIFEIDQEMSSVEPSEILLIDDSRNNLMAVDQLGWHAIWFNDNDPTDSIARIKSALDL